MINHVDYRITDHCNLNCAGCNQFGPLAKPWCISYDDFCKEWTTVRDTGLVFGELRILGGETLLHPQVGQLLEFLRSLYPKTKIVLYTNGILLHQRKEELIPIFKENGIELFISHYPGISVDPSGFPWVVHADESRFMCTSLHKTPDYDPDKAFRNCNMGSVWQCRLLKNYHLYPCSMTPNLCFLIDHFSELKDTPLGQMNIEDNGIDVRNHSIKEIEDFLWHSTPACAFCNTERAKAFSPWYLSEYKITEWVE